MSNSISEPSRAYYLFDGENVKALLRGRPAAHNLTEAREYIAALEDEIQSRNEDEAGASI